MSGPITMQRIRVAFAREIDAKTGESQSVAVFLDVPWRRRAECALPHDGGRMSEHDDEVACYTFFEGHSSGSMAYFRKLEPVDNSILLDILKKVVYKGHEIIEVPMSTKATWEKP